MRPILSLTLLFLAAHLSAALPGVPEAPDALHEGAWVKIGNDSWALPPGPDDNRTAEESFGFHLGRVVFDADHSMLTAFGVFDTGGQPTRIDELLVTAGIKVVSGEALGVTLGVGGIARGNLEGQVLQDTFHRYTASGVQYHEPFDASSYAGLVYGLVEGRFQISPKDSDITLFYSASGTATNDGELLADVFAGVGLYQTETKEFFANSLHIGVREQFRHSSLVSPTIRRVFDYESGTWVDFGFAFWRIEVDFRYSPFHQQSVADLTYRF